MIDPDERRKKLNQSWTGILGSPSSRSPDTPFTDSALIAMATSFSFGLDDSSDLCSERSLMRPFVAYLRQVLDEETYNRPIPLEACNESASVNGRLFGKPIWDFKYPDSSIFVTDCKLIGCCMGTTLPGQVVCAPLGSTYPFVVRPDGQHYSLRGYSFGHGIMHGERHGVDGKVVKIR